MTQEQFVYWLQGFAELREANRNIHHNGGISEEEWQMIKDHLKTVFHKVTPDYTVPSTPLNVPVPATPSPYTPNTYPPFYPGSPTFPTVIC